MKSVALSLLLTETKTIEGNTNYTLVANGSVYHYDTLGQAEAGINTLVSISHGTASGV